MELSGTVSEGLLLKVWGIPREDVDSSNWWWAHPVMDMILSQRVESPSGIRRLKSPDHMPPGPNHPDGLDIVPIRRTAQGVTMC